MADDADGAGTEQPPDPAAAPVSGSSGAGTTSEPDEPQDVAEAAVPPLLATDPVDDAVSAPGAAGAPADPEAPTVGPEPEEEPEDDTGPWWSRPAVRDELRDTWDETRGEVREAAGDVGRSAHQNFEQALEVGAMIGDAIADRLPPGPTAAAQKKGLDLRWLHLKLNIPAVIIAGAAWWGVGPADGVTDSVRTDGVAAPLGAVLLFVLLAGALMLLPFGSALTSAVAHLVTALSGVLWRGLARAWRAPYLGYLLRLVVVTVLWVVIIGFVRLVWRALLTWLTGV